MPVGDSSFTLFAVLSMKYGITEIIIAEQEWYFYKYILIRSGTGWLYMCMVTLQPSASMFSIYIDVNDCTKWPYINTY